MITIPEKLDNCVNDLKKQGKSEAEAYAICTDSLKKTDQKKQNSEPFHKFSNHFSVDLESKKFEDKNVIEIECLKSGKFRHPWYGVMSFDEKFFNNIIKNFEANIPNPEIAFDFKHQPDWGAAAWIESLFVKRGNLFARASLTKKGRQSILDKEFRYFSIEYTDDYVEYLFTENETKEGKKIETEKTVSHGPTILGGGLTNRPFIKGMGPVSLSETGEIIEMEEVLEGNLNENLNKNKEVKVEMDKTLEELKAEQEEIKKKLAEIEEDKDEKMKKGEKKAKEEEDEDKEAFKAKLSEISENIKKLSEKEVNPISETKTNNEVKKFEEAERKLQEKNNEVKKLSEDVKVLSETLTKLMESNKVLQDDKHKLSVERKLDSLKKLGVFPATLKTIESIAFSDSIKNFNITLSEDDKDVSYNFLDIVEKIFDSVPQEFRFSDKESSESVTTPTGNSRELSIEDVEKFSKENSISFEEALVHFSKEGKIQ